MTPFSHWKQLACSALVALSVGGGSLSALTAQPVAAEPIVGGLHPCLTCVPFLPTQATLWTKTVYGWRGPNDLIPPGWDWGCDQDARSQGYVRGNAYALSETALTQSGGQRYEQLRVRCIAYRDPLPPQPIQ